MRHCGVMVLTPQQHLKIAEAYEKAAADYMVPPQHRKAFARKAELFRMLAQIGIKKKLAQITHSDDAVPPVTATSMASLARHLFAWQDRR
jgi:hypothetical protein